MAAPGRTNVTRYVNGINNVADNNILADFGMPDPTKWITHFDDFINYTAGDWTITAVGSGTSAQGDGLGGQLVVTTSGASGDGRWAQKLGRSFVLSSGKRAFFKARLKIDNVATSSLLVGLQLNDTTPEDATDGIYFIKQSSNSIDFVVRKDATTGSNSAAGVATLVNDTFIELAWFYDGEGSCYYAVDGVVKGSIAATSAFLPDTTLSVSFGFETNAVATRAGTVDYVFAALER